MQLAKFSDIQWTIFPQQMGVNLKINTVTTRYVQVQEQRKLSVLTAYHQAVFATPKNAAVGDNSL